MAEALSMVETSQTSDVINALPFAERLIGSRIIIQGASGAGKTYAIRKILETTHGQMQHLVLDVEDELFTLRERFDYALIGGDHGDAPLGEGAALAQTLLELGVSAILSLNELPLAHQRRYIRDFVTGLMEAPRALASRSPGAGRGSSLCADIRDDREQRSLNPAGHSRPQARLRRHVCHPAPVTDLQGCPRSVPDRIIGRVDQGLDRRAAADTLGFAPSGAEARALMQLAYQFWIVGPALAVEPRLIRFAQTATTHLQPGHHDVPTPPPAARVAAVLATLSSAHAEPSPRKLKPRADNEALAAAEERGFARGKEAGERLGRQQTLWELAAHGPFDWLGFFLISVALFCFTYVLSQGSRWDWFEEPRIVWLTVIGSGALLAFPGQQALAAGRGLLDFTSFQSSDFSFAFIVSFVAGAALFGSAFLIPSFAVSVLAFTPTDAGRLLLPSGALFIGALLIAAFLVQMRRVPPIATVPFGILMIMAAMWMLSGSTSESGADDMMPAILLRGSGLGFLLLSITLIAFGSLNNRNLASGIGLFNTGRQLGGLMGVAGLQTLIDHNVAANATVLGASITAGASEVSERLTTTTALLVAKGMDAVAAGRAATPAGQGCHRSVHDYCLRHGVHSGGLAFCNRRAGADRDQNRTLRIFEIGCRAITSNREGIDQRGSRSIHPRAECKAFPISEPLARTLRSHAEHAVKQMLRYKIHTSQRPQSSSPRRGIQ
jgi:hypothetical protein